MVPKGWKILRLSDIAKISSGGTPSRDTSSYWDGDIPWVRTTEVQNCRIHPEDIQEHITQQGLENSSAKIVAANSILLAMIGQGKTRGQVAILRLDAATNQNCASITLNEEQCPDFYFQQLLSKYQSIRDLSNSAGQSNLSGALVKSIEVIAPPLHEQTKIAQILSTWDQAIATTERLLANSQQQKQGLMQQLLTGELRFPNSEGEWHEVEIGSIIKEIKRPVVWDDDAQYRLLSVKRRAEGVVLREILAGSQILTKKMNTARSGDFLISKMQVTHGAMGLVTEEFDNHHISDSYIAVIAKDATKLDINFFSWLGRTKALWRLAFLSSYGVHIEKLTFNFSLFLKEKINIPTSLAEQQKIAQVLSTADAEIANLQAQLDKLRLEKKALMQQLLTGQRRVRPDDEVEAPTRRVG